MVESKCVLEPLWWSTYLMEGMRLVSLYLMLFFGAVIRVVWACLGTFLGNFSNVWKCLSFVLQIVMGSSIVAMFLLQNLASNTVLYCICLARLRMVTGWGYCCSR
ncbi:hypothetical protein LOK49_LG02G00409 [Camellia lanceoleosa]|uniref:Uncharacterized protein n=1 Tax=Camellia lanceoleosa TaxID=1840588 RepID=A0ACC0IM48_9ERIC|nr:hypothetical protein LOK49_LG02G00409 [Camellia lanceoleosa]